MHRKSCFSIAAYENHVKIQAAGPFAIDMILPGRKNAWENVFFNDPSQKPCRNAGPKPFFYTAVWVGWAARSGVLWGAWGSLGAVLGPKTAPKDPQTSPKGIPKEEKTTPKCPKYIKSRILDPQRARGRHSRTQKQSPGGIF